MHPSLWKCFFLRYLLALMCQENLSFYLCMYVSVYLFIYLSISYLKLSFASVSPDLCSLHYFELLLCTLFLVLLYIFIKLAFVSLHFLISSDPWIPVISDAQNGIPIRIIWGTCKTCWLPDPTCWGSDSAGLGLNPRICIFQMCPINSDAGGLQSTLLGNSCWSECVEMAWKCRLTYCRHGYGEFPTLENIERLRFQTLTKIKWMVSYMGQIASNLRTL